MLIFGDKEQEPMQVKGVVGVLALLALLAAGLAPVVFANPINPVLNWSPNPVTQGSTTTATYGVAIDADCPTGQTFTGTLKVVEPDGVSTATVTLGVPTPCGTSNLSAVYPTAFTGTAGTTELGTYSATWSGTTSAIVGGVHPTFNVQDNFVVVKSTGVPEFPVPAILVSAIGLVLIAAMKKGKILPV